MFIFALPSEATHVPYAKKRAKSRYRDGTIKHVLLIEDSGGFSLSHCILPLISNFHLRQNISGYAQTRAQLKVDAASRRTILWHFTVFCSHGQNWYEVYIHADNKSVIIIFLIYWHCRYWDDSLLLFNMSYRQAFIYFLEPLVRFFLTLLGNICTAFHTSLVDKTLMRGFLDNMFDVTVLKYPIRKT